MKFSNKFINGIFLAGLLPFLSGCDKNEAVYVYTPEVEIQYVNTEGNILYFDKDGSISYFDKDDYYSQIKNISEEDFLKTCPMEILSLTNEIGIPIEYRLDYKTGYFFRFSITEKEGRKSEYSYIIKYKIPLITGDSVEEIRVTLKDKNGIPDGWYNCQYNGKDIRVYTIDELFPGHNDPQRVIDEEEDYRREREMLYNGDLVAADGGEGISLILPVDIAP